MATVKYIVDGQTLSHVGHNGIAEVFYFTKDIGGSNELIEVPFSFDGSIVDTSTN